MARYIDADLIKNIELIPYKRASENINAFIANVAIVGAKQVVDKIPTADVAPVIHAHWINHFDDLYPVESTVECSNCHEEQMTLLDNNYCPHCGAKMDEEVQG